MFARYFKSANSLVSSSTHVYVRHQSTNATSALRMVMQNELNAIKNAGTWMTERLITTKQDSFINFEGSENRLLDFCSNNYLGLSSHPEVIQAGKDALSEFGAGLSSVRFICGTQVSHKLLEDKISKYHGREDTILYTSCYDANAGIFEVLLTSEDAVLSDELNHASIINGIRLCKANKYRYMHRNIEDLEAKLEETQKFRMRLIVTDGVFSVDGNIAPLKDICRLAEQYKALVLVDDCHGTGFFGDTGRGTEEFFNIMGKTDIINSTLGKALGGAVGGYTTGPKELIQLLRQRSRPYVYSNSLPPPVVACASKAFDILMRKSDLHKKVKENTARFRVQMKQAGFTIGGDDHPISPVMLGDAKFAVKFAEMMFEKGIHVVGFGYPSVPKGTARIRVQISASHSTEDIDRAVQAFIDVGKKLNVI